MDKPQARYREVMKGVRDANDVLQQVSHYPKQWTIIAECPAQLKVASRVLAGFEGPDEAKPCGQLVRSAGLSGGGTLHPCACGNLFVAIPPKEKPE